MRLRHVLSLVAGGALLASLTTVVVTSPATAQPQVTTITLQGAKAYRPQAPSGATDDYHCTLLDPHVKQTSMIVSSQFFPQSLEVHHAILFLVPPDLAADARAADRGGNGWSCFGESALPTKSVNEISSTPWLSAWAPGRKLDRVPTGTGVPLPQGSLVVMQIHYNMLIGDAPVRSKLVLNTVPGNTPLHKLGLDLLPAPPDIPCASGVNGPLCNRTASLVDTGHRFGQGAVGFVNFLENFCGRNVQDPPAGATTSCTWPVPPGQIVRLTAHMHLLGTGMKMVLDPGTPRQQTLMDVTNYNFHDQRSYNLAHPVTAVRGDRVQVTCTYNSDLRQELPALRKLPPRFVTWGDGSSDEMCLGLINYIPSSGTLAGTHGMHGAHGGNQL